MEHFSPTLEWGSIGHQGSSLIRSKMLPVYILSKTESVTKAATAWFILFLKNSSPTERTKEKPPTKRGFTKKFFMQRLPTSASPHSDHGFSCSVLPHIPFGLLFKIKLVLLQLLDPVRIIEKWGSYLLFFQSFGGNDWVLWEYPAYKQGPEEPAVFIPHPEGICTPDFVGWLLLGCNLGHAWGPPHAVGHGGCPSTCWHSPWGGWGLLGSCCLVLPNSCEEEGCALPTTQRAWGQCHSKPLATCIAVMCWVSFSSGEKQIINIFVMPEYI